MKAKFHYHSCTTLSEALYHLSTPGALPYAGGTDMLVTIQEGKLKPMELVDIKRIPELTTITWEDRFLRIGAAVTITQLAQNEQVNTWFPTLSAAAKNFGCHEIRNRATIGGNIANSAPCAQTAPPLYVLDGIVEVASLNSKKLIPIHEFVTGVSKTILKPGELVTAFFLPKPSEDSVGTSLRVSRVNGMDLPAINMAVQVYHPMQPAEREIRFCLGSVATVPARFPDLEEILSHKLLDPAIIVMVTQSLTERINPRKSSIRATPEYKKHMAGVLLGRALADLLKQPELAVVVEEN